MSTKKGEKEIRSTTSKLPFYFCKWESKFVVTSNGLAKAVSQAQFASWLQLVPQGKCCESFPSTLCCKEGPTAQKQAGKCVFPTHGHRSTLQTLKAAAPRAVSFGHLIHASTGIGVAEQTESIAPPAAPVASQCFSFYCPGARKKCLTSQGRFEASVQSPWDVSSPHHQPVQVARH